MKKCNFCGRTEKEVKRIITAKDGDIGDTCVLLCMEILINDQAEYKEIEFTENNN